MGRHPDVDADLDLPAGGAAAVGAEAAVGVLREELGPCSEVGGLERHLLDLSEASLERLYEALLGLVGDSLHEGLGDAGRAVDVFPDGSRVKPLRVGEVGEARRGLVLQSAHPVGEGSEGADLLRGEDRSARPPRRLRVSSCPRPKSHRRSRCPWLVLVAGYVPCGGR